jgi:hypothetical protein
VHLSIDMQNISFCAGISRTPWMDRVDVGGKLYDHRVASAAP